eukprot:4976919-Amphidinium_carterae.1
MHIPHASWDGLEASDYSTFPYTSNSHHLKVYRQSFFDVTLDGTSKRFPAGQFVALHPLMQAQDHSTSYAKENKVAMLLKTI